jgi:hypothetical protein
MELATSPEIYFNHKRRPTRSEGTEMPNGNLATLSLDALAEWLAPRIAPQISAAAGIPGAFAERSDILCATGSEPLQSTLVVSDSPSTLCDREAEPGFTIGILLCLLSLGIVAITTVAAFFGAAFLLLAHPAPEMIAGADAHDRGAEVKTMGSSALAYPSGASPSVPAQTELSLSAGSIHPLVAAFAEYLATQPLVWRPPNIDLTPPSQTASAPEPTYSATHPLPWHCRRAPAPSSQKKREGPHNSTRSSSDGRRDYFRTVSRRAHAGSEAAPGAA